VETICRLYGSLFEKQIRTKKLLNNSFDVDKVRVFVRLTIG
jgi:hypothetical protein